MDKNLESEDRANGGEAIAEVLIVDDHMENTTRIDGEVPRGGVGVLRRRPNVLGTFVNISYFSTSGSDDTGVDFG